MLKSFIKQIQRSIKGTKASLAARSKRIKYIYEIKTVKDNDSASSYAKQIKARNASLRNQTWSYLQGEW